MDVAHKSYHFSFGEEFIYVRQGEAFSFTDSQHTDHGDWYLLFKFTNNFTFGGITGLAVLIAKTGFMTAGDFNFVASMTLLVIGMIVLGKKFAAKTAYCSILLSVTLSFLERVCPMKAPLTDQPMLELCFAIALPALGSAILFNIGSSSGGTDIIAMILKNIPASISDRLLCFLIC